MGRLPGFERHFERTRRFRGLRSSEVTLEYGDSRLLHCRVIVQESTIDGVSIDRKAKEPRRVSEFVLPSFSGRL